MTGKELVREIKTSIMALGDKTYGGLPITESQADERARNIACWLMDCRVVLCEEMDTVIRALAQYSQSGSNALSEDDRKAAKAIAMRLAGH